MKYFLFFLISLWFFSASAQGCSDAGFCTMGAMKPDQNYNKRIDFKLRSISIQYYRGKTTLSPVIDAITLDAVIAVGELSSIQFKVPYQRVEGDLGSVEGWGDISLSFTRRLIAKDQFSISGTLGGKIPTNKSRATDSEGLALPMYYQTSLGSYDVVAGLSLLSKKWLVAVGYQQALTRNENDFNYGEWVTWQDKEYLGGYDVGIGLLRGIDLMLRLERNFRFVNYSFNLGVLPIYRITPDKGIIRARDDGGSMQTTGLALSALGGFSYFFDVNNTVRLIYGHKITDREANPDGLTRDWVFNLTYEIRF